MPGSSGNPAEGACRLLLAMPSTAKHAPACSAWQLLLHTEGHSRKLPVCSAFAACTGRSGIGSILLEAVPASEGC